MRALLVRDRQFLALWFISLLLGGCGGAGPGNARRDLDMVGDGAHASGDTDSADSVVDIPTDDAGGDSAIATVRDPALEGPFVFAERDDELTMPSTGEVVPLHIAYPTGTDRYPVMVFVHGFQLPTSQYDSYLHRLASFGYVAIAVDYPESFTGNDNPAQAAALVAAIDWLKNDASLGARVDDSHVGMSGHSLGGKLAPLAATLDHRVGATFTLDPVDNGGDSSCDPPTCVEVKALMPNLMIPTGFIGETTDATGWLQACAPAADNYTTFYAQANSPSLEITAVGANHMSFLDDVSACNFMCSLCNSASADHQQVVDMARAFMVAFYERHLRGHASYDRYLTGVTAQERYVTTGRATLRER